MATCLTNMTAGQVAAIISKYMTDHPKGGTWTMNPQHDMQALMLPLVNVIVSLIILPG